MNRHLVGWRVEHAKSATLLEALFLDAMTRHVVSPDQSTLHADRGGAMKAKTTALMPADLGVLDSRSRPPTSNADPFSKAHFKMLKYQPEFPRRPPSSRPAPFAAAASPGTTQTTSMQASAR